MKSPYYVLACALLLWAFSFRLAQGETLINNTNLNLKTHGLTNTEIAAAGSAIVDSTKNIRVTDNSLIGPAYSSPAIGRDGTLYLGSLDNNVYALNPDLTVKWKFWTDQSIMASPVIGRNGTIYVGSMDNYLYALNPDGTLKWKFKTGGWIIFSPALGGNGAIYLESFDGYLYALSTAGSLIWKLWTGTYTNLESIKNCPPSVGRDGTIYLTAGERYLYAVNPDGSLKGKFFLGFPVETSPVIGSDGTIYYIIERSIVAFNLDGTLKWMYEVETENNPTLLGYELSPDTPSVAPGGTFTARFQINNPNSSSVQVNLDVRYKSSTDVYGEFEPVTYTVTVEPGTAWYERPCTVGTSIQAGTYSVAWYLLTTDDSLITSTNYIADKISVTTIHLQGDVDGNGVLDNFDKIALQKVLDGVAASSVNSDVDGNGKTDIFDMIALEKLLTSSSPPATVIKGIALIHIPFGFFKIMGQTKVAEPVYNANISDFSTKNYSSLAIDISGTIYFGIDNYFCALNPDGTSKWIHQESAGHSFSSIAIGKDGTIYTGCIFQEQISNESIGYGVIYAFDPNGTVKWQSPKISVYYHHILEYLDVFSPLTIDTKGVIYFALGGFDGSATFLHALDSGTNAGLADSPWPKWGHDIENSGNAAGVSGSLPGDVNADGSVDILDILTIVKFALGKKTPTSQERTLADLNPDGKIDIMDVLACVNKALGKSLLLAGITATDNYRINEKELEADLLSLGADKALIADIFQLLDQQKPSPTLPKAFSLGQNAPNPFNPSTTISYSVPEGQSVQVSLKIYDLRGRLVCTLVEEMREPGSYSVFWDGREGNGQQLSSGVYLYRMRAGDFVQTRKMVLLK